MPQSATCKYFAARTGNVYTYDVTVSNTSDDPFEIYAFVFGGALGAPIVNPYMFQDAVVISMPPDWVAQPAIYDSLMFATYSPATYIAAGQSGAFSFQSATAPIDDMQFGCCYYLAPNAWGFCTTGIADRQQVVHKSAYFAHVNPLLLILGNELFTLLNLPRPADGPEIGAQAAARIRSMPPEQRDIAGRRLDAYIRALTGVRNAMTQDGGR